MLYEVITRNIQRRAGNALSARLFEFHQVLSDRLDESLKVDSEVGGQVHVGAAVGAQVQGGAGEAVAVDEPVAARITSYNVCYTKLLRVEPPVVMTSSTTTTFSPATHSPSTFAGIP